MSKTICYHCFREMADGVTVCPVCGYDPERDKEKYPLALPHGSVLNGRYIVGRVLGQGGFGITYVAQDWKTKQRVAIKEYLPDNISTRRGTVSVSAYSGPREDSFRYGKECFLNEAKTLAEFISNPNVVRVHCYFEENGTAYFVMDYVEGISFQKYLQDQGGKVSWQKAEEILFPVMDALAAVHSRGIIHRDVTPDNIFITSDGTVKLLDFGAARYSLGDQSRSLDVVLKHGYAPKEQYTRHGRQGPYTDIYSVAASFYVAVTGRKPPDSIDRLEEDDLVMPSSLGVDIPAYVEEALLQGLAVQPADRFQGMGAFKAALQGAGSQAAAQNMQAPLIQQAVSVQQAPASGKPKWLIPVLCCAGVFLTAAVVMAVVLISYRKPSNKQAEPAESSVMVDGKNFAQKQDPMQDTVNGAAVEDAVSAGALDDSYDTLHALYIDQVPLEGEVYFIYEDFDDNGTYEAFGISGDEDMILGIFSDVRIFFISSSGTVTDVTPEEDFWGYLGADRLQAGNDKFLVWEMSAGGSGSLSFLYGVRGDKVYQPEISGSCMWFAKADQADLYVGYLNDWSKDFHDYIEIYYCYEDRTGEFVEIAAPAGAGEAVHYYNGTAIYGDYVLPESSQRYYYKYELSDLNADALKVARNEIFARHNRLFKDEELQGYFDSCDWYSGWIAPDDFEQEKIFNDFEKENIKLIKECESEIKN